MMADAIFGDSSLSFEALSQRVDSYAGRGSANGSGSVERWALSIALLAPGGGVIFGPLISGSIGLVITQCSLVVECLGFAVFLFCLIRREWKQFARPHQSFAQELDKDYVVFREYVAWLGDFPNAEIGRRLRYIRDRKETMSYRLGLFTGGLERFGILPLLAALYLQFKDWRFGDWSALGRVNMLGGLLLWALLLAYIGGWFLIRLRTRLDAYEALLAERLNSA